MHLVHSDDVGMAYALQHLLLALKWSHSLVLFLRCDFEGELSSWASIFASDNDAKRACSNNVDHVIQLAKFAVKDLLGRLFGFLFTLTVIGSQLQVSDIINTEVLLNKVIAFFSLVMDDLVSCQYWSSKCGAYSASTWHSSYAINDFLLLLTQLIRWSVFHILAVIIIFQIGRCSCCDLILVTSLSANFHHVYEFLNASLYC